MIHHDQTRPDGGAGQMFMAVAATPNRLSFKKTHAIPKGHVQLNSTQLNSTKPMGNRGPAAKAKAPTLSYPRGTPPPPAYHLYKST